MCPASSLTYKYRIYNVHQKSSNNNNNYDASTTTSNNNNGRPAATSFDRRDVDIYRSFARPRQRDGGSNQLHRSRVRLGDKDEWSCCR